METGHRSDIQLEHTISVQQIKLLFLTCTAGVSLLCADTLVLHNGSRVHGTFVGGDSRSVRFAVGSQVNNYNLSDIDSIRFDGGAPEQPPPPPPRASRTAPAGMEIPAGTQIVVRLIDDVDSQRDNLGQTFRASLDQPVVVNGETVIPRGADAIATLIDAQKSGKIEGRTVLTLDLKSITVDGRSYDIVTTGVAEASGSRGARSAKVIGGATALGAIIGAAAAGGRGAAIGAGSGAALGTAAQVATSGQRVRIPSETRLTFTLQNPIGL